MTQDTSSSTHRSRAMALLALVMVFGIFSGIVMGILLAGNLSTSEWIVDSPTVNALRSSLAQDPENPALQGAVREADLRIREAHFAHLRRMKIGALLLLVGVTGWVISFRVYMGFHPRIPVPGKLQDRTDPSVWIQARRQALVAMGVSAGVFAVILVSSLLMRPSIQRPSGSPVQEEPGTPEAVQKVAEPLQPDNGRFKDVWPRFRGPEGLAVVPAGTWPETWDVATGSGIRWKVEVPSPGQGSPILWGAYLFLTGCDGNTQEVLCFDRETGTLVWRTPVPRPAAESGEVPVPLEEMNVMDDTGFAAPSPVTDGQRVYVLFASGDVAGVDFSGKIVWSRNLGLPENAYGHATSLDCYQGKVIVQMDRGSSGEDGLSAILALDGQTGKDLWRTPRPVPNSWTSPIVVKTDVGYELITSADPFVISYDPDTGKERWRLDCLLGEVAPSPVYADGLVFVTNDRAYVVAIKTGGQGELTETQVAWKAEEGLSDASSPLADSRYFLQANSMGSVTCYGAKDGKLLWQNYFEATFWASPTLVGEKVYLPADDGKIYIFEWADTFKPVSEQDLGEPLHASPAFGDGEIYVRTDKSLFCLGG